MMEEAGEISISKGFFLKIMGKMEFFMQKIWQQKYCGRERKKGWEKTQGVVRPERRLIPMKDKGRNERLEKKFNPITEKSSTKGMLSLSRMAHHSPSYSDILETVHGNCRFHENLVVDSELSSWDHSVNDTLCHRNSERHFYGCQSSIITI